MKLFLGFVFLVVLFTLDSTASVTKWPTDKGILGQKTPVNKELVFDIGLGSANPKFQGNAGSQTLKFCNDGVTCNEFASGSNNVVSKVTTYTATGNDDVILVDSSGGAWTLTLPAAASNTGHVFTVIKTDSSFNAVTIDPNASETIDSDSTTTVNTQRERLEFVSDGSNWYIISRTFYGKETTYTPSFTGIGTVSTHSCSWTRLNRNMLWQCTFTGGTPTATEMRISIPFTTATLTTNNGVGTCSFANGHVGYGAHVLAGSGLTYLMFGQMIGGANSGAPMNGDALNSGATGKCTAIVPIDGWN